MDIFSAYVLAASRADSDIVAVGQGHIPTRAV